MPDKTGSSSAITFTSGVNDDEVERAGVGEIVLGDPLRPQCISVPDGLTLKSSVIVCSPRWSIIKTVRIVVGTVDAAKSKVGLMFKIVFPAPNFRQIHSSVSRVTSVPLLERNRLSEIVTK